MKSLVDLGWSSFAIPRISDIMYLHPIQEKKKDGEFPEKTEV
jgi:hypothetical protein